MLRSSKRPHIVFFSQTGSEIVKLYEETGHIPSLIITNWRPESVRALSPAFNSLPLKDRLVYLPNRPAVEDYLVFLEKFEDPIITLHGWLRVVPEEVCNAYEIYNGHPGLISQYKELQGKDPQEKAYSLALPKTGSVIHKVTSEVDGGEVVMQKEISIKGLELSEVFRKLRDCSFELWVEFFKRYNIT